MNMTYEDHSGSGVVRVAENQIDAGVAIQFKERFRELVQPAAGDVILDLSAVEFLDSSGLGAVVAARKLLGEDRVLILCGLQPAVDKVMQLTRMNTVFAIYVDSAKALEARGIAAD